MPEPSGRRRRLRWWLGGAGTLLVVVAVLAVNAFRNTTTPLSADEIETAGGRLYAYETTGFEEIDALTGARHAYPAETFVTVRAAGCGFIARWDALAERWNEDEVCAGEDGFTLARSSSFHRWFGINDLQEYRCDPPGPLLPPEGAATWSYACTTGEKTNRFEAEMMGSETVQVGGRAVETVHVRVTARLSGTSAGGSVADVWRLPESGLVVQETVSVDSSSDSAIGRVNYIERYTIKLRSLDPVG